MKPFTHALRSVGRYRGKPDDYLPIHDFLDSTKAALPDIRHRIFLHNSFGIFIVEKIFGTTLTNSDGDIVSVRDVAEDHVMEDLGFIPTLERCVRDLEIAPWMAGGLQKRKPTQNGD